MCKDPKQIKFAPLNRDTEHTAEELMTIFEVRYVLRCITPLTLCSKTVTSIDIYTSSATLPRTPLFMTRTAKCCPCLQSSTLSVSPLQEALLIG